MGSFCGKERLILYQVYIQKFLSEHMILMMFVFPIILMLSYVLIVHFREMRLFRKFFPYKHSLYCDNFTEPEAEILGDMDIYIDSKNFLMSVNLDSIIRGKGSGRIVLFEIYKDFVVLSYAGLATRIYKNSDNYEIIKTEHEGLIFVLYSVDKFYKMKIKIKNKEDISKLTNVLKGE